MAIAGEITLNGIQIYQVDADPSTTGNGVNGDFSSLAIFDQRGIYQKVIAGDDVNWGLLADSQLRKYIAQAAHGFTPGQVVYFNGTNYSLAIASDPSTTGFLYVVYEAPTVDTFIVVNWSYLVGFGGLTSGQMYYLSDTASGGVQTTKPTNAQTIPVFYADSAGTGYLKISYSYPSLFREVSSSTPATTTSTTDVQITGMTLTPPSGKYLVLFSGSGANSGASGTSTTTTLYVNAVAQADTVRVWRPIQSVSSPTNSNYPFHINKAVTVTGTQAIEVRWKVSAGTGTMNGRTLSLLKLS